MPEGKPEGVPCVQLLPDLRCAIFGRPERPAVCVSLRPTQEMCGGTRTEAMEFLEELERVTRPMERERGRQGGLFFKPGFNFPKR